jgi:hypothetical protein
MEEPGRVDGNRHAPDRHEAEKGHPSNGQPSFRGLHDRDASADAHAPAIPIV